ncbi:GHKL domain-containing protein [Viridibacillus sp. YIM B01967]|uniref:histidine kinase n=1 Tax=Viridibacillus soli TaxID=2798301 RepID=A0ABS1H316_9BACL|nr:HAMP domain-containing sensor histidine kinase [Viridibacillus soli]MBK3493809.1 GHKL domain-containing protein [Viridibacillus soli]
MFETLLLNFLFLLIPFLAYLIFFENGNLYKIKSILNITVAITMVLCMTLPFHLDSGFIFDLRYIPCIIVSLYWGYKNTILLYIVLNTYRFIIGGDGVIQSLLFSTIVLVAVSMCSNKFKSLDSQYRISFATMISFFTMFFYLATLSFQMPINREFWILSINAITTHVVLMIILLILIERIISNMKAREVIIQSDRLQVISELSASVAHEIRNPLTITSGFLQLLSHSESISLKDKDYVEYSLQELKRAEKIVGDFLTFSKPLSENMVDSNLKEETEYAKNILIPYANMYNVNLHVSFHNSLHKAFDKNQMHQCFINLYKNGIEAMKDTGGTLMIDISEQKKNIIIKIKDQGIGMTDEEISFLGKPYYSTKKEGTGLGMLMVYSTIHKVKGLIKVESEKGKGTVFTIMIPV